MIGQNGYIWLHRKLLENPVWTQLAPAVAKVAIYFLLRANYKPIQWYDGSTAVDIPAGSFITSLEKTALACNISKQQTRDAFRHLARTHYATYRRTHHWTLVTVVNWSTYQALPDEENTRENTRETTPETTPETTKRTLNKNIRSKEYSPLPPKGAVNGVSPDPDELPFATILDPQPFPSAGKNGNGRAPAISCAIQQTAARIHARHPNDFARRDCSAAQIEKRLAAAIVRHRSTIPAEELLNQVDRNHAAWCASDAWRKDDGQFAKGLENWLAPTKDRYLIEPPPAAAVQSELPRMVL